jgi:hypothetical protein
VALLYADILGMRARWQAQRGVSRAYARLERFTAEALQAAPPGTLVGGGIQTDAVALLFEDAHDAAAVGIQLFRIAFDYGNAHNRMWLRGVVLAGGHPNTTLAREQPLSATTNTLTVRRFSKHLMAAINAEASGYRGHRLLVAPEVLTNRLTTRTPGGRDLRVAHRLHHSHYPDPMCAGYQDLLWMAPEGEGNWEAQKVKMLDRLRWSGRSPDEYAQAAATMLAFAEVEAICYALDNPDTGRAG